MIFIYLCLFLIGFFSYCLALCHVWDFQYAGYMFLILLFVTMYHFIKFLRRYL